MPPVLVTAAGAAVGLWVMVPGSRVHPSPGSEAPSAPITEAGRTPAPTAPPTRQTEADATIPTAAATGPDSVATSEPTAVQAAFSDHAQRAAVQWSRSVAILEQGDPPLFAEIALQLARRMAAVTPATPAPTRQELINEERQLIEALRRRYEGIPTLMQILDELDTDLQHVQDQVTEVGPSPAPRQTPALPSDGLHRP